MTPQAVQALQTSLAQRLLDGLTDEQRATARLTPSVDGDRVSMRLDFQNPDGLPGRKTITVNPRPLQPQG